MTSAPRYASASAFSFCKINAETSCGVYSLSSISVFHLVPICLFTDNRVLSEFVTACLLAVTPIRRSPPSLAKATTEGVVLAPSAFAITTASPFSIVATQLFVVPRSIPITLLIFSLPFFKILVFHHHHLHHHRQSRYLHRHFLVSHHHLMQNLEA